MRFCYMYTVCINVNTSLLSRRMVKLQTLQYTLDGTPEISVLAANEHSRPLCTTQHLTAWLLLSQLAKVYPQRCIRGLLGLAVCACVRGWAWQQQWSICIHAPLYIQIKVWKKQLERSWMDGPCAFETTHTQTHYWSKIIFQHAVSWRLWMLMDGRMCAYMSLCVCC